MTNTVLNKFLRTQKLLSEQSCELYSSRVFGNPGTKNTRTRLWNFTKYYIMKTLRKQDGYYSMKIMMEQNRNEQLMLSRGFTWLVLSKQTGDCHFF